MVEPMTLGVAVAALVAKVAEKAIEKTADGAVDAVPGAVGKVVAWVKHRFAGRAELAKLEDAPDSPSRKTALGQIIDAELIDDERTQLFRLLEDAQRAAPSEFFHIGSITATHGGVAVAQNTGDITMTYNASADRAGGGSDPS